MDKLKQTMLTVDELTEQFLNEFNKEDASAEQSAKAMAEFVFNVSEKANEQVLREYQELRNVTDKQILENRGIRTLTSEETRYYNEVKKSGGKFDDLLMPETIVERVFKDLQEDRPLLRLIQFVPGVGRQKIITGKRHGKAVWGPLHKNLEGQLEASFAASTTTLHVLTAYFIISNDTLDLGPTWIDRFVRICLQEAVADSWEEAIISGTGKDQPIGLMKDLKGSVVEGVYPDKKVAGTLTFKDAQTMVGELSALMKGLSKYEFKYTNLAGEEKTEKRNRKVRGKVYLIVNPENYFDIVGRVTTQNAAGVFVTNLPFIPQDHIIESNEVPVNKLIAYVDGEYDATVSSANRIYESKERFVIERATLKAIDLFGDGKPIDNYAAQIYDIKIPASETVVP